jgi:hypothetical protein
VWRGRTEIEARRVQDRVIMEGMTAVNFTYPSNDAGWDGDALITSTRSTKCRVSCCGMCGDTNGRATGIIEDYRS